MVSFFNPRKQQKTKGFLVLSRSIKWIKPVMGYKKSPLLFCRFSLSDCLHICKYFVVIKCLYYLMLLKNTLNQKEMRKQRTHCKETILIHISIYVDHLPGCKTKFNLNLSHTILHWFCIWYLHWPTIDMISTKIGIRKQAHF